MATSEPQWMGTDLLDRLVSALESATEARRFGTRDEHEAALDQGLAAIGPLYALLDAAGSPEASVHLEAAYDECLRAFGGNADALAAATARLRSIRTMLQ